MEVKKALLTIIVILAFALIATSISQMTGLSVNEPTTITVSPESILPGDTIEITVIPGEDIKPEVTILKSPSMTIQDFVKLECGEFKCRKGQFVSATYRTSVTDSSARYIVKAEAYNTEKEVGSVSFTIL